MDHQLLSWVSIVVGRLLKCPNCGQRKAILLFSHGHGWRWRCRVCHHTRRRA